MSSGVLNGLEFSPSRPSSFVIYTLCDLLELTFQCRHCLSPVRGALMQKVLILHTRIQNTVLNISSCVYRTRLCETAMSRNVWIHFISKAKESPGGLLEHYISLTGFEWQVHLSNLLSDACFVLFSILEILNYTLTVFLAKKCWNIFVFHLLNKWLLHVKPPAIFFKRPVKMYCYFLSFFNTAPKGEASHINVYHLTFIIICEQSLHFPLSGYIFLTSKPFACQVLLSLACLASLRLSEYSLLSRQRWVSRITHGFSFINVKHSKRLQLQLQRAEKYTFRIQVVTPTCFALAVEETQPWC